MTALANPFDFSNPVEDPWILAGRDRELKEAQYYVEQARAGSSYSLAFIGDRQSGKTSLLNAVVDHAASNQILAASIRLDNAIVDSEVVFFREVYGKVMREAANNGLFGGIGGRAYDKFYRQIVFCDDTEDAANEPLSFGRIYATSVTRERRIPLLRSTIQSDFEAIISEARANGFPAVLVVLDEANLLSADTALLQAIRNLLMDTRGLVFALAGTEAMFPALTDVFSPVPRQFVRINVGNFERPEDTRRAVVRRLLSEGYTWALPEPSVTGDIHRITRGNPYEIVLVSHFAFRQATEEQSQKPLQLTRGVLEHVAGQLVQQNPALQTLIDKVNTLSHEEQQRLRESLDLDDVTLKSLAVASLAFDGDLSADVEPRQEELRKMFAPLAATDFIALHDDTISIRSDPVEQVFLRYALADKQPGKGPATLETPSIMLGRRATDLIGPKLMNALKASIAAGRTRTSTEAPPEDTVPLHDDDIYTFRVEFRYGLVDSEIGHFFVANFDDRDAIDLAARAIHDEVADKMAAFGLDLKYLGTLEVDQARIQERLRRQQTSNDPAAERFNEVLSAFWTSSASGRELTRAYAVAIENGSQALPANEAAATMYSNVAFMLLGYGEIEDYWRLSERAISEGPLAISLATRALMQAKKARFDDALNTLSDALDLIADEHEIWNMYSPMFLLSDANHPLRHELIELQSGEILDVYGRVIAALGEGRSPAEALVGTEEVPTRVLLLAAVLAEVEGNDDLAAQIRGRRADTEN